MTIPTESEWAAMPEAEQKAFVERVLSDVERLLLDARALDIAEALGNPDVPLPSRDWIEWALKRRPEEVTLALMSALSNRTSKETP